MTTLNPPAHIKKVANLNFTGCDSTSQLCIEIKYQMKVNTKTNEKKIQKNRKRTKRPK